MRISSCLALTVAGLVSACSRPDRTDPAAARAAVRAALDTSVAAWNRGDLDAHVAIYADSAVFRPSGGARGPTQARRAFAGFFAVPARRPALALDSLTVVALGADHVLATGQYVLTGGVVPGARRGWFTEVWTRTAAGWRIVLDHST